MWGCSSQEQTYAADNQYSFMKKWHYLVKKGEERIEDGHFGSPIELQLLHTRALLDVIHALEAFFQMGPYLGTRKTNRLPVSWLASPGSVQQRQLSLTQQVFYRSPLSRHPVSAKHCFSVIVTSASSCSLLFMAS
jgi:hypothetical protein